MPRIAVLSDSGTDLPHSFVEQYNIHMIPLAISYSDGTTYKSEVDITSQEVVERFDTEIPKTSLPSPEDIHAALMSVKEEGFKQAIFVGISSGLSATCSTVRLMAEQVDGLDVRVIDTKSIGASAGMCVIAAARMVEAGLSLDEICTRTEKLAEETLIVFTVSELEYLYKGGRINTATYKLGSALNIKPIFTCDEAGNYAVLKKARGFERALKMEISTIVERAQQYDHVTIALDATSAEDHREEFKAILSEKLDNIDEFVIANISADLIVHTGPRLMGVAVQPTPDYSA